MSTLTLPAFLLLRILRALVTHASSDETRPALASILVRSVSAGGKPHVDFVATDGHRMALYRLPAHGAGVEVLGPIDHLIPAKDVAAFVKLHPRERFDDTMAIGVAGAIDFESRTLTAHDVTRSFANAIGTFPPYVQVLPKVAKGMHACLDPDYLADACASFSRFSRYTPRKAPKKGYDASSPSVTFRGDGPLDPTQLTSPDCGLAIVIMPRRANEPSHSEHAKVSPLAELFALDPPNGAGATLPACSPAPKASDKSKRSSAR